MIVFKIIFAILSLIGMYYLAYELDKRTIELNKKVDSYSALCVGGIACCGIILGLMLGTIFFT